MNNKEWTIITANDFASIVEDIYSQRLDEATVRFLQDETKRGFPNTKFRQNIAHEVKITKITYFPFVNSGGLIADAGSVAVHPQGGNKYYNPEIYFHEVVYEQEDNASNVTFVGSDKKDHSIQPIIASKNDVRVRCQCLDYFFRFAHINNGKKAHLGSVPPAYVRKTTTRPPANPLGVSGMCKHLHALIQYLEKNKIIR